MSTLLRVLTDAEIARIHEDSLAALSRIGMRIDSAKARRILGEAGARVDEGERRVRFPRELVEAALASAPRRFSLGGRRTGFKVDVNAGECTLMPDGESTTFFDPVENARLGHHATYDRWEAAGKPDVVGQARDVALAAIAGHQPLPFADGVAEELLRLEQAARGS